jgi:ribosomal protein S18 acetylase RimI-like enzyme
MNKSIEVREGIFADAFEVARLLALLGHDQPGGDTTARLAAFLAQGQRVLVASRSPCNPAAPLLGVLTLHITPVLHRAGPIGRITALVVDDGERGGGIGRALVSAAEALFARSDCALVEVTSNKKRTDAHAFYERLGYTATSFRFAKALPPAGPTP